MLLEKHLKEEVQPHPMVPVSYLLTGQCPLCARRFMIARIAAMKERVPNSFSQHSQTSSSEFGQLRVGFEMHSELANGTRGTMGGQRGQLMWCCSRCRSVTGAHWNMDME